MFIWPIENPTITRDFYYKSNIYVGGMHAALDMIPCVGPATGEPIRVVADGVVAGVGWDFYSGFFVAVDHAGGWRTFYRHLYGQTPVSVGQHVTQGQIVGSAGNTGYSLGAHLHFDLWNRLRKDTTAFYKNGWWAHDPKLYLGKEDKMTPEDERKVQEMITASLRTWIGPRDETMARIDRQQIFHRRDNSKHSAGEQHSHPIPEGRTGSA